jgi:hypothetical protein
MQARPTDVTLGVRFLRCVQTARKLIVLHMLDFWFWYRASLYVDILISEEHRFKLQG